MAHCIYIYLDNDTCYKLCDAEHIFFSNLERSPVHLRAEGSKWLMFSTASSLLEQDKTFENILMSEENAQPLPEGEIKC